MKVPRALCFSAFLAMVACNAGVEQAAPPPKAESSIPSDRQGSNPPVELEQTSGPLGASSGAVSLASGDSIGSQLRPTQIAFNTPESILVGAAKEIRLVMDFGEISSEDRVKLKTLNGGKDSVYTADVRASELVAAKLSGDFEIQSLGSDTQPIQPGSSTVWSWSIKAGSPGPHKLYLNITSIVQLHGKERSKGIETFNRQLQVVSIPVEKMSFGQKLVDFLTKEWKWIWSAILVPVVGFLWSRQKKKDSNSNA